MSTRTPLLILSFTLGLVFGSTVALINMANEFKTIDGDSLALLAGLPGLFTLSLLMALSTLMLAKGLTLVFAEEK